MAMGVLVHKKHSSSIVLGSDTTDLWIKQKPEQGSQQIQVPSQNKRTIKFAWTKKFMNKKKKKHRRNIQNLQDAVKVARQHLQAKRL